MADAAIVNRATVAAPKDYTLAANEELVLKAVRALVDGSGASGPFYPCLELVAPDGTVMWEGIPANAVAAGGSADVSWFPRVAPIPGSLVVPGVTTESLFVDSTSSGVSTSTVLVSGTTYNVTVQGTFSIYNNALTFGSPEADAMYPGSTAGRVSTQVGRDAETCFAGIASAPYPFHSNLVQFDVGSGYSHPEPTGGPFSTPQPDHIYTYTVVGQGSALSVRVNDSPIADNYGKLLVSLQVPAAVSGGTLLPQATTADNSFALAVLSGVPTWGAVDGGSA